MKKITSDEIQKTQTEILNIFMIFRDICEKYHLRYWAVGGTLLGAVRHQGFIPWDDDLDVAMPDVDYHKFIEIAPSELQYPYELLPAGKLPHSPVPFAKIHNISTTFIEEHEKPFPDSYKGIFIDIFPFCGVPNKKIERWIDHKLIYILGFLNMYSKRSITNVDGLFKKFLFVGAKCLSFLLPNNYFLTLWLRVIFKIKFDDEGNKLTAPLWEPGSNKNLIIKKEWLTSCVEFPFETTTICCPSEYDEYLLRVFGNYMEFPPKEERRPTHNAFVDLNRPYTFYQDKALSHKFNFINF